ncbi:MAG: reverse transcriptase domain-containing protein, partial [Moraxellaceae bacterium]|nr:reverse transcriptase domain-containing protein [Moraxellaceae bacterium]
MISSDTSPSDLAYLLGTSLAKLSYVIYGIKVEKLYHKFEVPKKNGGVRIINAPDPQLKILQARLKNILESIYRPHPAATAFIRERGIVFNARKHVKKQVVFNIDLKDFYHQINFGRVRGLLISPPYSLKKETATLIAGLCCTDNVLPQGAPTSPIVSNMICRRLDRELSLLAKNNYFYYTRYADDITFSSHTNSDNNIYCSSSLPKPSVYLAEI